MAAKKSLTFLEQYMVQHAHPVKFVFTLIGLLWGVYELWLGDIALSVLFGIGLPLIGTVAVWGQGEEELSKVWFGKIMLIHANPFNLFFHIVGLIMLTLGIYGHLAEMMLWGITVIIFGHLWGLDRE